MSQMLESSLAWMTNNDLTWSYEEKADRLEVREGDSLITGAFLGSVLNVAKGFGLGIYITTHIDDRMVIVIS